MSGQRGKRGIAKAVKDPVSQPPLYIEFDESGSPIGENLHRFKSDFTVYCRAHIPYWMKWKKINAKIYNHVWDHMKDKWNISGDASKAKALMKLKANAIHRKFRTILNTHYVVPRKNPKPDYNYVNTLKWDEFVAQCNTPEFLAKSAKAKESAKKNTNPSRLGRNGYAGIKHNWKEKWEQLVEKYPYLAGMRNFRSKMYILGHLQQDFKEITPEMQERFQKLVEIERKMTAEGTINEPGKDPLTELLGKEHGGRTKGISSSVGVKRSLGWCGRKKNKKKKDKVVVKDTEGLLYQTREEVNVEVEAEYKTTQATSGSHAASFLSGGSHDSVYDIENSTPCDLMLTHLGKTTRVAIGKVYPSKNVILHGHSIRKGYAKVQVDTVLPGFSSTNVPIETDEVKTLSDATCGFIQWPLNEIKVHRTMSPHSSSQPESPVPFQSPVPNDPSMDDLFSEGSCYRPRMDESMALEHHVTSSIFKLYDEPVATPPAMGYPTLQTAGQPMDEEGFEDEGLEDGVDKMLNKLLDRSQEVQVVARRFTTRDNREDSITIYAPLNMYELAWSDQIEFKSLLLWCTNGLLDTSIIHWWAMNLYSLATKRGKNKCAFLNPSFTHYGECKMNSGNVIAHIEEVKDHHNDKSIFIAPYFQGRHWTLLVVHKTMERGWTGYLLDSTSYIVDSNSTIIDKRHPSSYSLISYLNKVFDIHLDNWTMVKCHQQVDKWEGGYYVMRFMHDLVLVKQNNFPRNIWNDDSNLSSKELDQIVVHSASQFITFVLAPGDRRANQ